MAIAASRNFCDVSCERAAIKDDECFNWIAR